MLGARRRFLQTIVVAAATCLTFASPTALAAPPAEPAEPSLEVSKTQGLDPTGETITVTGAGYDESRGIYVAFCIVPAPGQTPTPCGGGVDLSGEGGASTWVSSHPPDYGEGLAVAYGPGGTFETELTVAAQLNDQIDCRQVQCAVVTRSDHTRLADRSLDVIVPIFFDAAAPAAPPASTLPAVPVTAVTVPPTVAAHTDPAEVVRDARGAAPAWPVWTGTAGVAAGLVALAPRRRRRSS
ncbi:MAG TPA: hypothetical protein VNQ73_05405 [Ilumatobacter sp.]|nr:hypothetical protein [Ilumatobacter sp.]